MCLLAHTEGERKMENQEAYKRAKKKVGAKVGFYIHLAVFGGVNLLLVMINMSTSTGYKWPLWGWSIGCNLG